MISISESYNTVISSMRFGKIICEIVCFTSRIEKKCWVQITAELFAELLSINALIRMSIIWGKIEEFGRFFFKYFSYSWVRVTNVYARNTSKKVNVLFTILIIEKLFVTLNGQERSFIKMSKYRVYVFLIKFSNLIIRFSSVWFGSMWGEAGNATSPQ